MAVHASVKKRLSERPQPPMRAAARPWEEWDLLAPGVAFPPAASVES